MQKDVLGIILYKTPFKESSEILQILTKEYGLIGVIAKGSKKIKSSLRGCTEKFSCAKFHIYYYENKLSSLISADIINPYETLKNDIILISYLTYVCELTYQVAKQNNSKIFFDILNTALNKINIGLDPLVITNILEIKYLNYLGIEFNLNSCAICASPHNILTLDVKAGGYVCSNCYSNEFIVSPKTIKTIRVYFYIDLSKIEKINISNVVKNEINLFLTNYYDSYTGLYIKSKEFLNKLINNN